MLNNIALLKIILPASLKEKLTTSLILTYSNFDKSFYLVTNGFSKGLGVVLSQLNQTSSGLHQQKSCWSPKKL